MGGGTNNGKQVFFIGAWRAQQFSDQLLKQISGQIASKKGFLTDLTISPEGLELFMKNTEGQVTRHDKIALENIVDFIDNKYSTTCTLAIVRDKQLKVYTVFVFICKSDKDASALIQLYRDTKSQLSGEGYNTDLTPKGHNWVLQEKSEPTIHKSVNGEVRVFTSNPVPDDQRFEAEDHNMSADTRSRTSGKSSSSDVKEELSHLAEEVRDIKRLLEVGSRNRHNIEHQNGNYHIVTAKRSPMIPVTSQYMEREVKMRQVPHTKSKSVVYATRSSNNGRYPEGGRRVILTKGGSVPRSGLRHYSSVSPTRAVYTKRVYDPRAPVINNEIRKPIQQQQQQQVRYVSHQQPVIMIPRMRSTSSTISHRSDVVHKSIEHVYRARPSRRMYLPPRPTSPIKQQSPEVLYSEVNEPRFYSQPKPIQIVHRQVNGVQRHDNGHHTVHVRLNPEVKTYYEHDDNIVARDANISNVSTAVNMSMNGSEERLSQVKNSQYTQNLPAETIIVRTTGEISRSAPEGEANVKEQVESVTSEISREDESHGGSVYHVKAAFTEPHGNDAYKIGETPVDESYFDNPNEHFVTDTSEQINQVSDTYIANEIEGDEDVNISTEENGDAGLFESYVKTPEDYNEPKDEIVEEIAVRYHEDGDANDNDEATKDKVESDNEVNEVVSDVEAEDEETENDRHDEIEDEGLFGAYAKTPEEYGEPESTVVAEAAFRYHEDIEKTDDEDNENQNDEPERRVRYNDNVQQIAVNGDIAHTTLEDRNLQATFENSQLNERGELSYGRGISARIQRLTARAKGESLSSDEEDIPREQDYKLDMDALRQYTSDPSVVIIESESNRRVKAEPADDYDQNNEVDPIGDVDTYEEVVQNGDIDDNEEDITNDIDNLSLNDENVENISNGLEPSDETEPSNEQDTSNEADPEPIVNDVSPKTFVHESTDSLPERVKLPVTDEVLKAYIAKKSGKNTADMDDVDELVTRSEGSVLF